MEMTTGRLDVPRKVQSIEAPINYIAPTARTPYVDVSDPSASQLDLESHNCTILDARTLDIPPSLEREGFMLVRHKLPAINYRDHEEVVRRYLPAVQELIVDLTRADRVVVSDGPVVRFTSPQEVGVNRPNIFGHTDYTDAAARAYLRLSYDRSLAPEEGYAETRRLMAGSIDLQEGQEPEYKRVLGVQTWRVLSNPPHDIPLAVCAANSVAIEDRVDGIYSYGASDLERQILGFTAYRFNPRHAWYYFSDMEPDEVLVMLGYDFNNHEAARVLHSAFRDPNCPSHAVGRSSIDVRTFAFFKNTDYFPCQFAK
ncbi:CmcJ/NvfI family oxidoreductase [Burkholderia ubonensis]|uniref:CmcJ/NvfI family oxidoreductase n=1 Tax=Burkholderia ubonensis TaxID=101571 RepID=UPI000A5F0976|nr:CmcJ/NvfI family oxidoreductase [Burkholderia ubonensis]